MQTDTWWQLRAGQDMWESRRVLLTDTFSHTAFGSFWLNHEWLAEVIFYGLYRVGGLPFLTIFSALLIACGWMLTWAMSRGISAAVFVLTLVALLPAATWWEPRPHAFSLLFIPLMVFLVQRREKGWWLPLVFVFWANCHGGVLLGLALLGVCLTARTLVRRSELRQSIFILLACAAAMTMTPLGLHFWTEIPKSLARINQYTLDEWLRPGLTDLTYLPFWGIAAAYVVLLVRRLPHFRSLTPSEVVLHASALALLPGAVGAVRNVGPFLMLAVPALTHVWAVEPEPEDPKEKPAVNVALMLLGASLVVLILTASYRAEVPRLKWSPMPQGAIEAVRECEGNLYNRYDEGGMLTWFVPERKVFLDGRQDPFPTALVLEHIEMETGKRDYKETFARHDIRCAFLPLVSPVASSVTSDGWIPTYRDPKWIVLRKP